MITNKMAKFLIKFILLFHFLTFNSFLNAAEHNFAAWLENFKNVARSEGVSENTINDTLKNIKINLIKNLAILLVIINILF